MSGEDVEGSFTGRALEDWEMCIPWDGDEKSLPLGAEIRIPGLTADRLVQRWKVLDAESEEGFREIFPGELRKEHIVIGAKMNENLIQRLIQTYGPRAFLLIEPDKKQKLTRYEWREKFGTDGLELMAIKSIRRQLQGGGVRF
jgi:hypothetical protein